MNNLENFLKAIQDITLVEVTFNAKEKGVITRKCVPFDFGPSRRKDVIDKSDKFHFYDIDSPNGSHNLALSPSDVMTIKSTSEFFEPADYIKWAAPYNWFISRNWGKFS